MDEDSPSSNGLAPVGNSVLILARPCRAVFWGATLWQAARQEARALAEGAALGRFRDRGRRAGAHLADLAGPNIVLNPAPSGNMRRISPSIWSDRLVRTGNRVTVGGSPRPSGIPTGWTRRSPRSSDEARRAGRWRWRAGCHPPARAGPFLRAARGRWPGHAPPRRGRRLILLSAAVEPVGYAPCRPITRFSVARRSAHRLAVPVLTAWVPRPCP